MKRSEIKALFPEATKDQIDSIMDLHGEGLEAVKANYKDFVPKSEMDTIAAELKALKEAKQDDKTAEQLVELETLRKENEGFKTEKTTGKQKDSMSKLIEGWEGFDKRAANSVIESYHAQIKYDDKGEISNAAEIEKTARESKIHSDFFGTEQTRGAVPGKAPANQSGGKADPFSAAIEKYKETNQKE